MLNKKVTTKTRCPISSLLFFAFFFLYSYAAASITTSQDYFKIELSEQAHIAVNNGVALTIETEYAKTSKWASLFSWHLDKKRHEFVIMRHALSNRYLVKQDNNDAPKIFRSIPEALNFISYQATLLLESYNNQTKEYAMRVYLNKFKLPSPMRLNAFLSEAWHYDSGWQH